MNIYAFASPEDQAHSCVGGDDGRTNDWYRNQSSKLRININN